MKHKQWKSNFRCAINSHNRVFFVKEKDQRNIASRRVIRIAGPVGGEKKYEGRVPKRKLYKSSRSSKTKYSSFDDNVLNSVETLENCARLLLSLKRSSSTSSSGSASSSKSFNVGDDFKMDDCSKENIGICESIEKDDGDMEEYDSTKIEEESINNSELINVSISQNPCLTLGNNPSPTKDDQKAKKKFDCSCSGKGLLHDCSHTCTKYPSLSSKEYCNTISNKDVKQSYDYSDISTNDSTPLPDDIPKASIPTTVIVTINNNFRWQADPNGIENDPYTDNCTIARIERYNENIEGDDYEDDDEDLIIPRNWEGAK